MSFVDSAPATAASDERTKEVQESSPLVNLCLHTKYYYIILNDINEKEQKKAVVLYNLLKNC